MAHVVIDQCIGNKDTACIDVCPVDCIYGADDDNSPMVYIHPEECIDCSLCVDACPVEAIFYEDELPEGLYEFKELNAERAEEYAS